jgi:hypothetical protein
MALKLLQPGLRPMGQFDLEDDDQNSVLGGEFGIFEALQTSTDAYASDSAVVGPQSQVTIGDAELSHGSGIAPIGGLIDEGTSGANGYGTLFGSVIGGTVGQGTGLGSRPSQGVVTVGPRTTFGSGKVTLFHQPGLYGVTEDAVSNADFTDGSGNWAVNTLLQTSSGKLTSTSSSASTHTIVGYCMGTVNDSSLVSTTFTHASGSAGDAEYGAIYFTNVQSLVIGA